VATGIAYPLIPVALRLSAASLPLALAIIGVFFVSRGPAARLLSLPVLVYLGEISFAFYIVHKMVLRAVGFTADLPIVSAAFVGCVALAALLHHAVEIPANARLRRMLSKAVFGRAQ
jgi:peptidoglycan/LPS O-acetylase OafA/YrhL